MLKEFKQFIALEKLFSQKEKILLAVSGGMDSVVMTELFHLAGFNYGIAHCNFQLRGEDSEQDEKFVADLSVQEYSSAAEAGLLGHHYGLTLQPWSDTEPERLEFSLHLSAVAAALNEEMMMMAFSGDGLTVHRG